MIFRTPSNITGGCDTALPWQSPENQPSSDTNSMAHDCLQESNTRASMEDVVHSNDAVLPDNAENDCPSLYNGNTLNAKAATALLESLCQELGSTSVQKPISERLSRFRNRGLTEIHTLVIRMIRVRACGRLCACGVY